MLNLNPGTQTSSFWEEVWKVLIYDQRGSDIIAPLFHVGELRKQGITLNMFVLVCCSSKLMVALLRLLHSDRKHIPDVPAIYFVQPSRENIKRIAEDVAKNLYDSYYLNFISSLSRPLMEELAAETLKSGSVNMINQVSQQPCRDRRSARIAHFELPLTYSHHVVPCGCFECSKRERLCLCGMNGR